MSKFIAQELETLIRSIERNSPGIRVYLNTEAMEEISGHPSGWREGLKEYLKHKGTHLQNRYAHGFEELLKATHAEGEHTSGTSHDQHENEPGHAHKKPHGHEEHLGHLESHQSDSDKKDKDQEKSDENKEKEKPSSQPTQQRVVETEEPEEEYDEGPSEEGPVYEPQMPMMSAPVEASGGGHADEGLYGGAESTPESDTEGSGGSSAGDGDNSQNSGGNKKKGGLPSPVQNQLNKLNPINKLNPLNQAKDLLNPETQLKNLGKEAIKQFLKTQAVNVATAIFNGIVWLIVTFWPVWVTLIAIVLIVAVVLWLLPSSVSVPVVCGDFSDKVTHFQWAFYKNDSFNDTMNNLYHINNHQAVTDPLDPLKGYDGHNSDSLTAEAEILNTNCLLFGHGKGYLTGSDNFTTFAKLLLGDRFDPTQGYDEDPNSGAAAYLVDQDVLFDMDSKSAEKCYTTIHHDDSQNLIVVAYHNPEKCGDNELRYQIAESLSHVIIFQQEKQYGKGKADILRSFEYGPLFTQKLPVYTCSDDAARPYGTLDNAAPSTDSNGVVTGENETDEKQRFCFGDMVGEYMVYPNYFPTMDSTTPTPNPTPLPTGTPPPTTGAFNSPLSKFNTGPYKAFYEFARLNLFDGQDMFQLLQGNANAAACPFTSFTPQDELSQLSGWGFTLNHGVDNSDLSKTVPIDPIKDQQLIQKTFDTICLLYQSPTYVSLLGANSGSAYNIMISFNPPSGWGGYTSSINHVTLYDMNNNTNDYYLRFILTHELGHVLQFKNPDLVDKLDNAGTSLNIGSINCPRSDIQAIKISEARHAAQLAECFSDYMALYLTYPEYSSFIKNAPAGLSSFGTASEYSDIYSFLFHYVFGGTEYVDSGRTKDLATYAKNLNLSIQRSCPPPYTTDVNSRIAYVSANDQDCLKTLDFHPAQAVFDELWHDIIPTSSGDTPTLQCVGTVRASTIGIGADIGGNDAGAYADEDIPGYQRIGFDPFSKTFSIQTGDILIWAHHIGIAVYVYPDKSVDLAESNIWFPGNDSRPSIIGGVWIRSHTPYDTIVSGLRGLQRKQ